MQISLLPVVTIMIPVFLFATSTESSLLRGDFSNHEPEDPLNKFGGATPYAQINHLTPPSSIMSEKAGNEDELLSDTEYERICSAISLPGLCDEASSFRVIERYDECTQQDEYAVGAWTADPGCCNIGPDECARLGVPSTCDFDAGDVSYWHCLFCCET